MSYEYILLTVEFELELSNASMDRILLVTYIDADGQAKKVEAIWLEPFT